MGTDLGGQRRQTPGSEPAQALLRRLQATDAVQRISDAGYDEAGKELERLLKTPSDGRRE